MIERPDLNYIRMFLREPRHVPNHLDVDIKTMAANTEQVIRWGEDMEAHNNGLATEHGRMEAELNALRRRHQYFEANPAVQQVVALEQQVAGLEHQLGYEQQHYIETTQQAVRDRAALTRLAELLDSAEQTEKSATPGNRRATFLLSSAIRTALEGPM